MSNADADSYLAVIATAIAALSLVLNAVLYHRAEERAAASQRNEQKLVDDGQRSAAAAEKSAQEAQRAADALERMALALEAQAVEAALAAPTPEVVWRLRHNIRDVYHITNAGTGTAYDVRLTTGDLVGVRPLGDIERAVMDPNDVLRFSASRAFGTQDDMITVTWSDEPSGGSRKWTRPLPPGPRP